MTHPLGLEISDQLWQRLLRQTERKGMKLEELAVAYLTEMVAMDEDPLLQLAGSVESDVPDAAQRHHEYLGQALYDELQGRTNP